MRFSLNRVAKYCIKHLQLMSDKHGKAASDRLEYLRKDGFQPMMTGYNQWVNDITAKARAEGIVEGRAEGAEMERRKIVLRRLSQGDSIDEIVEGLGFEKEDVERIAAEAEAESKNHIE